MKIASIVLATAIVAVVGSVQPTFAQPYDSSGDQAGNSSESGSEMNAPTHPHNQWDRDRDWGADHEDHGMRGGQWDHGGMWRHHHMGMMGRHMGMMMGARERGARFHFKRGDATIDIRCPADEDVGACVNAASKLIDKIATMGGEHPAGSHANPPPPSPSNSAPAPRPNSPPPPGGTNGSGNQGNNGPGNAPGNAPAFNNRT